LWQHGLTAIPNLSLSGKRIFFQNAELGVGLFRNDPRLETRKSLEVARFRAKLSGTN
jgi:hypothetical protein